MLSVVFLVEVKSLAKGHAIRGFASLAIFRFVDKEASAEHHAAVAVVMLRQLEGSPFQFVCLCLTRIILFIINPGSPSGLYFIYAEIRVVRLKFCFEAFVIDFYKPQHPSCPKTPSCLPQRLS